MRSIPRHRSCFSPSRWVERNTTTKKIKRDYLKNALGSCMIEFGNTRVICSVSVEDKIPPFLRGKGKGWLTAEYGMLPASCKERIDRESSRGKVRSEERRVGKECRSRW